MRRFLLYDNLGAPLGEIAEADVFEATLREVVNGEHSLEITTTQVLDKGTRILYEDGRGYWHEFVVCGVDGEHASGNRVIGTYYCVWSIQHDLQGVPVSIMPGVQNPVTAGTALHAILDATDRWSYGTVTNTNTGGASMYDTNAWDALSILVENWGGEIDVTIGVDFISGVVSRAVDLYAQQGSSTPTRRFDFGRDLQSVKRTYDDAPFYCRISPRGKGEQTDAGGYGRKITIESVNDGKDYLEYAPMVDVAKLPDGNGDYDYPTLQIENSDCETPADLLAWAQSVLADYCTPKITYTISAVQAAIAGVDVQGVSLGDAVEIVDRKFGADGLRLTGRVVELSIDMLNERNMTVVIGNAQKSVASQLSSMQSSIDTIASWPSVAIGANMSTADYIDSLLGRINAEINATGGYTYIVQGHGIVTYDTAVTDPTIGAEASQVVEIKGGSIRIANSKTSGGEWEWKTVFTSGHISAELVTAAQITTGYIGSNTNTFIDLDNSIVQFGPTNARHLKLTDSGFRVYENASNIISHFGYGPAKKQDGSIVDSPYTTLGTRASSSVIGANSVAEGESGTASGWNSSTQGYNNTASGSCSHAEGYSSKATGNYAHAEGMDGVASGEYSHFEGRGNSGTGTASGDYSHAEGYLSTASGTCAHVEGTSCTASGNYSHAGGSVAQSVGAYSFAHGRYVFANYESNSVLGKYYRASANELLSVGNGTSSSYNAALIVKTNATDIHTTLDVTGKLTAHGAFTCLGTKSRLVNTDSYDGRLLYAYETPSPMFGDIGSGVLDSTGYCYVSIDDVFSEAARTDISYQVFLQACGAGALYVESKSSTYFVVRGEPGLAFDWEIKAKQTGHESTRLENDSVISSLENEYEYQSIVESAYDDDDLPEYDTGLFSLYTNDLDDYGYVSLIESLY